MSKTAGFTCCCIIWTASLLLSLGGVQSLPVNRTAFALLPKINAEGPYLAFIIPNPYELAPFLLPEVFTSNPTIPYVDLGGRRFYVGSIEGRKTIAVMTGLATINAAITTQQLFDYFDISEVLHYGIAGGSDDSLHIGDVSISAAWVHTGLWSWQRYGNSKEDLLPLEADGDFTREYGALTFRDYNVRSNASSGHDKKDDNLLNRVWYQPEEVFTVTGVPEKRDHIFYVPVDKRLLSIAKGLEGTVLESCFNNTCLDPKPKIVLTRRGAAASVFVDNAAYREFLFKKFKVSTLDMESAAVALTCYTNGIPFIIFRALSDLAGGDGEANQISTFFSLASTNAVRVVRAFVKALVSSTST